MKEARCLWLSCLLSLGCVATPGLVHAQPVPPTVATLPASAVAGTIATLNGTVNPSDFLTFGLFEWGTTINYGNATPAQSLGSGSSNTNISHAVGGLLAGVTYHFRAVASNSFYVVAGTNQSFTTPVLDTNKPVVVSAASTATFDRVRVTFSKELDPATANVAANYTITPALAVFTASYEGKIVTLTTAPQTPGGTAYTVTVQGVKGFSNWEVPEGSNTAKFFSYILTKNGVLKFSLWGGITGTAVDNLTSDPRYPSSPDWTGAVFSFDSRDIFPTDAYENYGATIEGYLTPTESSDYDFFLRSDDASQLFISTDATEANLVWQAEEDGCCSAFLEPNNAAKPTVTTAAPISLVANQKYFIRVIYKEEGGGDYAQVAWRKTADTTPAASLRPIPGKYLSAAVDLPVPAEGAYVTQTPAPNAADVLPGTAITIIHRDGKTPWTADNVTLELDGVAVISTFTKEANVATITYQPTTLFASETTHRITIGHPDPAGQPTRTEWSFRVVEAILVVANLDDNGAGSLRQAIALAPRGGTIVFGAGVAGTISLTSGELAIGKTLAIVGPMSSGVTVNGNQASRVFHIYGGEVNLANLTIANGNTAIYGAGFFVGPGATLVLNGCTVSGNTSGDSGGGIANNGSVLATNCTLSGNRALQGGGIYTYAGPVLLRNCTVSSNSATSTGGGLYNFGIAGSVFTVGSTLVALNSAAAAPDVISNPAIPFISLGYNLIGNGDSGYGFANGINGDQVGSTAEQLDPLIGPLKHNGGPTFTMALQSGSPAIDKGYSAEFAADQRGLLRTWDFASVANAMGGDGSDIGALELLPTLTLTGPVRTGSDLVVSFRGDVGQRYRIEQQNTMAPGQWMTVADNLVGTGAIVPVTDPGAANQPQRFYRGEVLP